MGLLRCRCKLKSAVIGVITCYAIFFVACVATWMQQTWRPATPQGDDFAQWRISLRESPKTGLNKATAYLQKSLLHKNLTENTPALTEEQGKNQTGNQTKNQAKNQTNNSTENQTRNLIKSPIENQTKNQTGNQVKIETKKETRNIAKIPTKSQSKNEIVRETKSETRNNAKSPTKYQTKIEMKPVMTKQVVKTETKTETKTEAKNQPKETENKTVDQKRNLPQPELKAPQVSKCQKGVASRTKYSKWFRDKFQPSIKLFLDKDDVKTYKKFATQILPYGWKGQNQAVVNQLLLHKNFTNPPINVTRDSQGCARCAVVGSGGIMNGSGAGEEIDGHDNIFRLNRAIPDGNFTKDLGKRTTFYTFYPQSAALKNLEDESVTAFFAMFQTYDVNYALRVFQQDDRTKYVSKRESHEKGSSGIDPRRFKLVHPGFFYYVYQTFLQRRARPTTGALVLFLALHICDEVDVYGFGYDPRFSIHYYDKTFVKYGRGVTPEHNVENERQLWLKLHEEGMIRLFKRDP